MHRLLLLLLISILFISTSEATFRFGKKSERLDCIVLPSIAHGFLAHHIANRKLSPTIETRTIEQFIKRLDPSKVYLLKSDVDELTANLKGIFGKIGQDCSILEQAHAVLIKRLKESAAFAKETLGLNFKFQDNIELIIDPNRRHHPTSTEEFKAETLKFIQFQISNYLATDIKLAQAKKQLIHRYELNLKRQEELKRDDLYSLFLDAFASSLDAHSNYLSKDALDDFEIQMRLSLEGIGAALTWEDGYTTVESLIPGGSAERSGLIEPKDKIIAVAQGQDGPFEPVIDMPLREVVKLIRGKKGTTVRLNVLRETPKTTLRKMISLVRDKINLQDEAARLVYTSSKIGNRTLKIAVIDLPSFYGDLTRRTRSCYEDIRKLVLQAQREKADGVILDLSKNGGGLLSEAVRIGGLFINRGNIVATQDSRGQVDMLADENEGVEFKGPLVVLTSRLSASASEIVSGALQDYGRAVIVGADHTFGKGTVQAMMNLPADLGAIKVTTGMFYIPGGKSTQHQGVSADIVIPSAFSSKDIGEQSLDYSLPANTVSAFRSQEAKLKESTWEPVEENILVKLRSLSASRIQKDAEFKKILTELEDLERKKGVIKLSDSLKKQKEVQSEQKNKEALYGKRRRGRRKSDEEYLKQAQIKEAVNVMSDYIRLKSEQQVSSI